MVSKLFVLNIAELCTKHHQTDDNKSFSIKYKEMRTTKILYFFIFLLQLMRKRILFGLIFSLEKLNIQMIKRVLILTKMP